MKVKTAFLFHRNVNASKDGLVTVSGNAKNSAERDLVAKLAEDINAVKSVVNNITIDQANNN